MLYNVATHHAVTVVGIEGKDLRYNKGSLQYDSERENYMAKQIVDFQKNVVFVVGESPIAGLQAKLPTAIVANSHSHGHTR